eukprot:s2156_g5.t1
MAASTSLQRERQKEIEAAFDTFSVGGAGLGYHELKASLRALELPAKKADVLAAMRTHGLNADSVLDFTSFSQIEGSGRIGLRDLRRASKEAELPLREEELERMIAYFDQNSSGTIGEAEFVQVMLATDLQ